jgi:hypothetical protein
MTRSSGTRKTVQKVSYIHFLLFRIDVVGVNRRPALVFESQSHQTDACEEFDKSLSIRRGRV